MPHSGRRWGGYRAGAATAFQAVLQTGTAVLVDGRAVPRVRCACGNPLTPPVPHSGTVRRTGDDWPGFRASAVVVVTPAAQTVDGFVLYDPEHHEWFRRQPGDTGRHDRKTAPPARLPSPAVSGSASPSSTPPSPSAPSSPPSASPGSSSPPSSPAGPSGSPPSGPAEPFSPSGARSSSSLSVPSAGTPANSLVSGPSLTADSPVL